MRYLLIIMIGLSHVCACQSIDFSAYSNITNTNFETFVNLFPSVNLPVSSEQLRGSEYVNHPTHFTNENVDSFLKNNGAYIVPKLYSYTVESGETTDKYGLFYPVYKLPTNGDYVLLVVNQFAGRYEWGFKSWVLSYDLAGNFIKAVGGGFLIGGNEDYVSCSISDQLEFSYTYLEDMEDKRSVYWTCKPCSKTYKTDTYQILSTGQDSLTSSVSNGTASFNYNGYYFELE